MLCSAKRPTHFGASTHGARGLSRRHEVTHGPQQCVTYLFVEARISVRDRCIWSISVFVRSIYKSAAVNARHALSRCGYALPRFRHASPRPTLVWCSTSESGNCCCSDIRTTSASGGSVTVSRCSVPKRFVAGMCCGRGSAVLPVELSFYWTLDQFLAECTERTPLFPGMAATMRGAPEIRRCTSLSPFTNRFARLRDSDPFSLSARIQMSRCFDAIGRLMQRSSALG